MGVQIPPRSKGAAYSGIQMCDTEGTDKSRPIFCCEECRKMSQKMYSERTACNIICKKSFLGAIVPGNFDTVCMFGVTDGE